MTQDTDSYEGAIQQPLWKPTTDRILWFFLGLGLMYVVAVAVYLWNQPPAGAIPL